MRHARISSLAAPALLAAVAAFFPLVAGCKAGGQQTGGEAIGSRDGSGEKEQGPFYGGLIEEYRAMLAADPKNVATTIALANALYDAGRWQEAIRVYERALTLKQDDADVITDMGTCYRNLGMPGKALREYERALKINSSHQNALFNMGLVCAYDMKDHGKAIAAWQRLLKSAPNHPKAVYVRSTIEAFRKARQGGVTR